VIEVLALLRLIRTYATTTIQGNRGLLHLHICISRFGVSEKGEGAGAT
jgi:hypothetical protein